MKRQQPNIFIEFLAMLCIIVGSFTLSIFYISTWANTLLFDTNYYLNIVTPLPKNTAISKALSTYTVDTLFRDINVEERIRTALPEQAKFLASSLSDDLQNRSYQRTTQIIQSDQFSSLWVAANTLFHQKILTIVRGGGLLSQVSEKEFLQGTSLQFDGCDLAQAIKTQLGSDSQLFDDAQIQQFKAIAVPVYNKLQTVRQIVYWNSQLASMLLYVTVALILNGIALAFSRQKAFLATGIVITITMIIMLLTLQIIRSDFLNQITQSVYNSAAAVVWDSFLTDLIQILQFTMIGGILLSIISLLAGPYTWAKNFRKAVGISQILKSSFMQGVTNIRIFLAKYALWLRLIGIIVAVMILISIETVTISTVVIALSYLLMYLAILSFIFPRQKVVTR